MALTSIGKNVITTTTAAFDGQSKPNHITMIGATPTIGSAETKLPSGSSPRCRNGERSMRIATSSPAPEPIDVAGQHAADRLPEVGRQRRHRRNEPQPDRRGRRQDDRRHAEQLDADLPDRQHGEAKQQRRREVGRRAAFIG